MWSNDTKLVCTNKHRWVWFNIDGSKAPHNGTSPEYNKIYTCEKCELICGVLAVYLKEFVGIPFVAKHFVPVQNHDCTKDLANAFTLVRESIDRPITHQPQTS